MVFLEHFNSKKSKFGNGSAYINNTSISYQAKNEYKLDGDFTVDYWVYESSDNADEWNAHLTTATTGGIWFGLNNSKYIVRTYGVRNLIEVEKPKNNEWTHIAVCRKNNIISLYFDGKLKGSIESNHVFETGVLTIGDDYQNGCLSKNIYIDEVRIVKGEAKWESEFTPNNSEYNDNDSKLVFLDHLNNIPSNTISMTASIIKDNPKFGESSLYINNNYASFPTKEEYKLDKDFTIDYWVYESSDNIGQYNAHIVSSVEGGIWTGLYNGQYTVQITGGGLLISTDKPQNDKWTHVAICRENNKLSLYFNGELKGSTETDYVFKPGMITIGNDYRNILQSKNIYIDEVRILNGVAQWKDNFMPFTKEYK